MAEETKKYTPEEVEAWLNAGGGADLTDTEDQEFTGGGDFAPFPKGDYTFMITQEPELRKADTGSLGLFNMGLKVDVNGKDRMVWTNIWIHPNTIKSVKAFLFCIGMHKRAENLTALQIWNKEFAENLVGESGRAHFDIDPNPGYKPKNVVKYWLNEFAKARRNEPGANTAETLTGLGGASDDDELPF